MIILGILVSIYVNIRIQVCIIKKKTSINKVRISVLIKMASESFLMYYYEYGLLL